MKEIFLLTVFALVFSVLAAAQNKSVYTSTMTGACRTIWAPGEADASEGECKGVGGYKIRLLEGDLRQSINVITPDKKTFELNFWGFYSSFSDINPQIEWRTKAGVPVALIARLNVANTDSTKKGKSYLMISKIGKKSSCVVDIIKPGANQNEAARKSADAAAKKPCKKTDND